MKDICIVCMIECFKKNKIRRIGCAYPYQIIINSGRTAQLLAIFDDCYLNEYAYKQKWNVYCDANNFWYDEMTQKIQQSIDKDREKGREREKKIKKQKNHNINLTNDHNNIFCTVQIYYSHKYHSYHTLAHTHSRTISLSLSLCVFPVQHIIHSKIIVINNQ